MSERVSSRRHENKGAHLEKHADAKASRANPKHPPSTHSINEDHADKRAETGSDIVDSGEELRLLRAVPSESKHDR